MEKEKKHKNIIAKITRVHFSTSPNAQLLNRNKAADFFPIKPNISLSGSNFN